MKRFRFFAVLAGVLLLAITAPASAQIISAEQPRTGDIIHMSEMLRPAGDGFMLRALGKVSDADVEWALIIRSSGAASDVQVTLNGKPVDIQRLTTDDEVPQGMTTVYFTANDFYALAQAGAARVTVGDVSFDLPDAIQRDMQLVFERIEGGSSGNDASGR